MAENSDIEKRLSDLEMQFGDLQRRHDKTRELLIDALSYTMAVLACVYFQPDGWVTTLIVGGGAFIIASRFHRWTLKDKADWAAPFIRFVWPRSKGLAARRATPVRDEVKVIDRGSADPPNWLVQDNRD